MKSLVFGALIVVVATAAVVPPLGAQAPPPGQTGQTGGAVQTPAPPQTPAGQRGGRAGGGGGGGGRGRGIAVMTLTTTGWADGATIPLKYTQAGHDVSPALTWSNAPDPTTSFVVIAHDLDAPIGTGMDDVLHWLVWNIPGTSHGLAEGMSSGMSQGPELADGTRQISVTGPYYRGPAAPATGPVHHYVFEVFALDTMIDVKPVGAAPPATRAAVVAAMAGHIRGKATMVGLYKR